MNYERGRRTANRCALLASCAAVGMCIIAVFLMRISAFDKPFERESHYSCRAHDQSQWPACPQPSGCDITGRRKCDLLVAQPSWRASVYSAWYRRNYRIGPRYTLFF